MKVQVINKSGNELPKYETPQSAGMDLRADLWSINEKFLYDARVVRREDGTIEKIKESYKTGDTFYPTLKELPQNAPLLTVATDVVGFPFTDLTGDGAIVGIDIDILTIIANNLGYNLELLVLDTDEGFSMLKNGEVDLIISGLIYTEARDIIYDPSISYVSAKFYLHSRG